MTKNRALMSLLAAPLLASGLLATPGLAQTSTLRVATVEYPATRANPFGVIGTPHSYVFYALFDTLTNVDAQGNPEPGLATAWKNVSPTVWHVTLRPNIKFSNGESLDANTVANAAEYLATEEGQKGSIGRLLSFVASVRALDPMTVEFTTKLPQPIFPNQMAALFMVPAKAWKEMGSAQFANTPSGSGPFRMTTAWTDENLTLERNTTSWRPGKVDRLVYSRLSDTTSRVQALVSDQVDIAFGLTSDNLKAVRGFGGTMSVTPAPGVLGLALISQDPMTKRPEMIAPLKDKRVRQALNHAVNREAIAEGLYGGSVKLASQVSVQAAYGYNREIKPYAYDPAKAKALLAEAGFPNGFSMIAETALQHDAFVQVAADLAKVGVNVEMRQITIADNLPKYLNGGYEGAGFGIGATVSPSMDSMAPMAVVSCRKKPTFFCEPSLVPLLDQIDGEFDPAKRKALLEQLQARLHEEAPMLFLVETADLTGLGKKVQNYRDINRVVQFHEITLAK